MSRYRVVVNKEGDKSWYLDGRRHREGNHAVEWASGSKWWYLDGKLHREGGPAIENHNGDKIWYHHDRRHRIDGPAYEWSWGNVLWYFKGVEVSEEKHREMVFDEGLTLEKDFIRR